MELIDTHCHLDFAEFDLDRERVLANANASDVSQFVIPGVQQNTWQNLMSLCQAHSNLYYALGLHPMFMQAHVPSDIQKLEETLADTQPVAIGEIGLDFYNKDTDRDTQLTLFEQQLGIARAAQLPVIMHVRKAHEEVIAALKKIPVVGGIAHAFNGSLQQAQRYRDLNIKFGFGGMLTYARSTKLRTLAQKLELNDLVLETDSPDMTVEQHHGQRNSPEYLPFCLQALAEIREESIEVIANATTYNAKEILRL